MSANTKYGTGALNSNVTNNNSAFGYYAAGATTTGSSNTAVGVNALLANIDGKWNTAIGSAAMCSDLSGSSNVAVGSRALFTNTISDYNVAVGVNNLEFATGGYNTAVGYKAGKNLIGGGANTFLGANSSGWDNAVHSTAIGADAQITESNQIVLGNADDHVYVPGNRIDLGTNYIPTAGNQVPSKYYVDSIAAGIVLKQPCACATTGNSSLSGTASVDGVPLVSGVTRVLVWQQTNGVQNGIYVANSGAWTRSTDMAAGSSAVNVSVLVTGGDSNGQTTFRQVATPAVVGTNALSFIAQYTTNFVVGNGLQLTGNTLSVVSNLGEDHSSGWLHKVKIVNQTLSDVGLAVADGTGRSVNFVPVNGPGSYNSTTVSGDTLIAYVGNGGANSGSLNICQWSDTPNGIRMAGDNITVTGLMTAASNNGRINVTDLTGNSNTALGTGAMGTNACSFSTAVGSYALLTNNNSHNTAVGSFSFYNNTIGSNGTAIGADALKGNTTGSYNTAVGSASLLNNQTGTYCTAVGYHALMNSATNYNTAVGGACLASTTTGGRNTAVGAGALELNTTGELNNAFGFHAMYSNINGSGNNSFGEECLYNNTSGSANCAFGRATSYSNTTGGLNSAFGHSALFNNTTAQENCAFGQAALYNTKPDSYNANANVAVGSAAGYYNTVGSFNSSLGYWALGGSITGSANTGVGAGAGRYAKSIDCCTFLGADSSTNFDTTYYAYSTAIGAKSIITASDQIVMGGLNPANSKYPQVYVPGTLNVTGVSTLGSTLTVSGAASLNNTLNVTGASTLGSTLTVSGAASLNNTLNVTGVSTLGSTLTVSGAASLNNTLNVTGASTLGSTLTVSGAASLNNTLNVTGASTLGSDLTVSGTTSLGTRLLGYGSAGDLFWIGLRGSGSDPQKVAIGINGDSSSTGAVQSIQFNTNSTSRMYIGSTGYVGIGKTTPTCALDVAGSMAVSGVSTLSGGISVNSSYFKMTRASCIVISTNGNSGLTINSALNVSAVEWISSGDYASSFKITIPSPMPSDVYNNNKFDITLTGVKTKNPYTQVSTGSISDNVLIGYLYAKGSNSTPSGPTVLYIGIASRIGDKTLDTNGYFDLQIMW